MQTIWIADMMADYIISHKGEEYKIDLWEWDFVDFLWTDENKLNLRQDFDNWSMVANIPMENPKKEKIKEYLLDRIWVYEDEL